MRPHASFGHVATRRPLTFTTLAEAQGFVQNLTMGPPLEIERKFLVKSLPAGFEALPWEAIQQGYAADGLRFRRKGARYYETRKFGSGLVMEEHEREISREEFERMWPSTEGRRLEKRRTEVGLGGGLVAEVDLFTGSLSGLRYVEVEFHDVEAARAFSPPDWFGREVTEDLRYRNSSLARLGIPPDWNA
jgi:CYTH domain-containing protein